MRNGKFFLITLLVVILDQLSKFFVRQNFILGESKGLLTYIHNYGAGFSLFQGMNILFIIVSVVVIFLIFYYLNKIPKKAKWLYYCVALILGGTMGNLIDRVFFGYVIDFINLQVWPVFNIADACITIGGIYLVWWLWKKQ